jgi:hypothetical protein
MWGGGTGIARPVTVPNLLASAYTSSYNCRQDRVKIVVEGMGYAYTQSYDCRQNKVRIRVMFLEFAFSIHVIVQLQAVLT